MSDVGARVKEFFRLMPSRLDPKAAKGMDAAIQFNLTSEGGGQYYLEIKDGTFASAPGSSPSWTKAAATMTVTMKASDFVNLVLRKLDPEAAFMIGKLKIQGDMGLAMKMQTMLKPNPCA